MANNYNYQLKIYQASSNNKYKEVEPENGVYEVKNGNHIKLEVVAQGYWINVNINPKNCETENSSGFKENDVSFVEFRSVKKPIVISEDNIKKWSDETDKNIGLIEFNITIYPYISRYGVPFNSKKQIVDPKTREVIEELKDMDYWYPRYRAQDYFGYGGPSECRCMGRSCANNRDRPFIQPDPNKPLFEIFDQENTAMIIEGVLKFSVY